MRLGRQWVILLGVATGAAAGPQRAVSVPFVGCESSGQLETFPAPKGTGRLVPVSLKDAQMLAYYESTVTVGVLAPRGWYCEGSSGSSGDALYLSPKPIRFGPSGWEGLEGPAIEIYHIMSAASGRYSVAEIIARVFPVYRELAAPILEGMDRPLPSGPYPNDTLTYRSKTIVEYKTPAQTEGLGTHFSGLRKNDSPAAGAAILLGDTDTFGDPPDVLLLSVRLPADLARLMPVIVRDVERNAVRALRK
jgi:hypothetical protein